MNDKYIHVIIGDSPWINSSIKYRRNRIADYLCQRRETEKVYWFYPIFATPRRIISLNEAIEKRKQNFIKTELHDKMYAVGLLDAIPGRIQQHFNILNKSILNDFIVDLLRTSNSKFKKYLWFTKPINPYLINLLQWDKIVYDCSDLWTAPLSGKHAGISKLSSLLLSKSEEYIAYNSQIVFTTSDYLSGHIENISCKKAFVVENGVDVDKFVTCDAPVNDMIKDIPRPRLGYVGSMKQKINFKVLLEMVENGLDFSLVLIGPAPEREDQVFTKLISKNNVYWLGQVNLKDVPYYMSMLDVGLLPYKKTEYNKAVFPLKLFEYLAAGLPVVGCCLPSTKKYAEQGIYYHVDEGQFASTCHKVSEQNNSVLLKQRRFVLAKKADWTLKLHFMYGIVTTP